MRYNIRISPRILYRRDQKIYQGSKIHMNSMDAVDRMRGERCHLHQLEVRSAWVPMSGQRRTVRPTRMAIAVTTAIARQGTIVTEVHQESHRHKEGMTTDVAHLRIMARKDRGDRRGSRTRQHKGGLTDCLQGRRLDYHRDHHQLQAPVLRPHEPLLLLEVVQLTPTYPHTLQQRHETTDLLETTDHRGTTDHPGTTIVDAVVREIKVTESQIGLHIATWTLHPARDRLREIAETPTGSVNRMGMVVGLHGERNAEPGVEVRTKSEGKGCRRGSAICIAVECLQCFVDLSRSGLCQTHGNVMGLAWRLTVALQHIYPMLAKRARLSQMIQES